MDFLKIMAHSVEIHRNANQKSWGAAHMHARLLCWQSSVLLELDATGLFCLGSVSGPIKREQDEINKSSFLLPDMQSFH